MEKLHTGIFILTELDLFTKHYWTSILREILCPSLFWMLPCPVLGCFFCYMHFSLAFKRKKSDFLTDSNTVSAEMLNENPFSAVCSFKCLPIGLFHKLHRKWAENAHILLTPSTFCWVRQAKIWAWGCLFSTKVLYQKTFLLLKQSKCWNNSGSQINRAGVHTRLHSACRNEQFLDSRALIVTAPGSITGDRDLSAFPPDHLM